MNSMLRIDGRALGWDFRGLWWLILDHTGCSRSTARILIELTDAVQAGPLDSFEVHRVLGEAGDLQWHTRFTPALKCEQPTRLT